MRMSNGTADRPSRQCQDGRTRSSPGSGGRFLGEPLERPGRLASIRERATWQAARRMARVRVGVDGQVDPIIRRMRRMSGVLATLGLLCFFFALTPPGLTAQSSRSLGTAGSTDIAAGKRIFDAQCAWCHGTKAPAARVRVCSARPCGMRRTTTRCSASFERAFREPKCRTSSSLSPIARRGRPRRTFARWAGLPHDASLATSRAEARCTSRPAAAPAT